MKWVLLVLAVAALVAGTRCSVADTTSAQHFQIVAVQGPSRPPGVYLLNTNTGQSWFLVRETNEWDPLKYWVGPGQQSSIATAAGRKRPCQMKLALWQEVSR